MAAQRLTALTAITSPASGDKIYIVDVSDTTDNAAGSSRQITFGNLSAGVLSAAGITASVDELNILDGVTANATELNVLDGIPATLTATELGYVDGVTSALQTQIDAKAPTASPVFSGSVDLNGIELILDADADTSITADTDDRMDFRTAGNDRFRMGATDFDLVASSANITVGSLDPWRTININAGTLKPTTTSGCAAVAKVEAGTNDIDYDVLDFDQSSDERAYVNFQMPDSYDGGVIQFRFLWTAAAGSVSQTVRFGLKGRSYANDEAIDQAQGTEVQVDDTLIATGDVHISSWSTDVTLGGTPAGGEWIHLEIMRDISGDDLAADARLIGIQVRYKQAQYTD